mgnify:CR=1 FL=1
MRRGFDGLALSAQNHLGEDPQSGAPFVFLNKRRNRLKVLWFDRNDCCILLQRSREMTRVCSRKVTHPRGA